MKSCIIGISGKKNSGKDTVASMINYIFATGITNASFRGWITHKTSFDKTYDDRIIHFADGLKDVLSIMFNIDRSYFDRREYKDGMWYNLKSNTFWHKNNISTSINDIFIDINDLNKNQNINYYIKNHPNRQIYIKLRTLMQYFGTDICRNNIADDIWIKNTMNKAVDKAISRRLCIIPDVRFINEFEAINKDNESIYGLVINVQRNINKDDISHESEIIDLPSTAVIYNNDTKISLFYKVIELCNMIMYKL